VVGHVLACGEEHVVLAWGSRQFVVPFQEIRSINFFPEGSADFAHDVRIGRGHLGSSARPTGDDRLFCAIHGMRRSRLLRFNWADQRGAAPVEMTFAIILLMTLMLGVVQVAFALYARNVVAASAHEGARAAAERGRSPAEAAAIAKDVVGRATGRLIDDLTVDVATGRTARTKTITVRVRGLVTDFGPVPLPIPLSSTATAQLDEASRP
jgi:hypothetical protein